MLGADASASGSAGLSAASRWASSAPRFMTRARRGARCHAMGARWEVRIGRQDAAVRGRGGAVWYARVPATCLFVYFLKHICPATLGGAERSPTVALRRSFPTVPWNFPRLLQSDVHATRNTRTSGCASRRDLCHLGAPSPPCARLNEKQPVRLHVACFGVTFSWRVQ